MNNIPTETQNKRYQKKYKFVKLRIRSLVLENAALCDEVARTQESIQIVKDERKFLLRRLLEHENEMDISHSYKNEQNHASNRPRVKLKKRISHEDGGKAISIS